MEFRLYDRVDCNIFDLIGRLEPDQTKSLGFLFAKSTGSLGVFLNLIGKSRMKFTKYVVDCEPRSSTNQRFDILLRFYQMNCPVEALLIEAKSVNAHNASKRASVQLANYTGFSQLAGFHNTTQIVLTRDTLLPVANGFKSVAWSQLVSDLFNYAIKQKDEMALNYIKYLLSIQGHMNYYEEDVLAIPAGKTLKAVQQSGIYECPTIGKRYARQRKTLFITFKGKNGVMSRLYKLKEIVEGINLNDSSQIDVLDKMPEFSGIKGRIATYKSLTNYPQSDFTPKRLFVLDMENQIQLPNVVRPFENNSNWPYYSLTEMLQQVNSNIGQIIIHKGVSVNNNELKVNTNGKKKYDLYESSNYICSFAKGGSFILDPAKNYSVDVVRVNRGGHICKVIINYVNGKWQVEYHF